jgi:regulator of replication initiation timing
LQEKFKQELADTVELNSTLIVQRRDLNDHLHQVSVSLAEKEDVLKDYDEIKTNLELLKCSNAGKSSEITELNRILELSKAEVSNQNITIKNQNDTIIHIQAELHDIVEVNRSLQHQMDDSKSLLFRHTADSTELVNKYIKEIKDLNEYINKNLLENNSLKIEIENLQTAINEYTSQLEKQEKKFVEDTKIISKLEENILQYTIDLELSNKVIQGIKTI